MSFNQFTNLDFNDLRTQIKDYLRSSSDFSDFDFEGSNFSVLIDLLAYNSYITAFNTNMTVNEVFLDSATLRENVVALARNIGYTPRSVRAARARTTFNIILTDTTDVRTVTLQAGQVALGNLINTSYIYSIPEDFTTLVDSQGEASFDNLEIYEGVFVTNTFTVDSSIPNQRFILPNANIDTTTVRVKVKTNVTEQYALYEDILNVDGNSRLFLLEEVTDQRYEVRFGDGVLGKKPSSGSIVEVTYIVSNGRSGNGAKNFTFSGILKDNNANPITSGISLLQTISESQNGDDIESLDSIKYLAPRVYSSQFRAVTASDYKGLIPYIYTNVDSVTAYGGEELDPPEYGKVFISIKPRGANTLSQITKEEISRSLKQYSIAGIKPELIDLKYLFVEFDTTIYYNKNQTSDVSEIRTKVLNTLTNYSKSSDTNNFGGRVKYSKINALIDATDTAITSNITKVKMRRDMSPAFNTFATYEVCFGNRIYIKKDGYSIKSSGFKISGVNDTLYMGDIAESDSSGRVFFFKLVNNIPSIVKVNAGTIDYIKGEILLDVVNIESTALNNNVIEVEAVPDSNDIIGLKDLYLQIDVGNSVVNTVEDTITSGENTAATLFVPTSSYLNGQFTR
tara:strand:+ start:2070 stop:3941 length:1872 start_codon:yes stop_codon:yes gene_type:complete